MLFSQDRDKDCTGTIGYEQLLDIYRIYEVLPIYCIFVFCRLYPSSPSYDGSVWVLPVILLLLTYTISPLQSCLSI
jgi:hypothetical protein